MRTPLHPSLARSLLPGPTGGKGKTQQGIMQFLTKKGPAAGTAGAAAAGESPTGAKENDQQQQQQQRQQGGSKAAAQEAPAGEEIVID